MARTQNDATFISEKQRRTSDSEILQMENLQLFSDSTSYAE